MNTKNLVKVIKCQDTAEFLATLPVLMGYEANNSLVIALFNDARAQSVIRCDLPNPETPLSMTGLDTTILDLLERLDWVNGIAVIIYTDESFKTNGVVPRQLFAAWFEQKMVTAGFNVKEFACVAGDAWVSYHDRSALKTGHSLQLLTENLTGFESRLVLNKPLENFSQLADLPPENFQKQKLFTKYFERYLAKKNDSGMLLDMVDDLYLEETVILSDSIFKTFNYPPDQLAKLLFLIQFSPLWFLSLISIMVGKTEALELAKKLTLKELLHLQSKHNQKIPDKNLWDLVDTLQLLSAKRVPPQRLRDILGALRECAVSVPKENRIPVLCLASWAWWQGGMSTPATEMLAMAATIDANNQLVLTLEKLLNSGAPEWIFSQKINTLAKPRKTD